jgi:hypothetical protein
MSRSLVPLLPLLVACAPAAPVADAGFRVSGAPGEPFLFDGASSTGESLTFSWAVTDGPEAATLHDAETPWPVLVPEVEGVYTLSLTVCDAWGVCDEADTVAIVGSSASRQRSLGRGLSLGLGGFKFGGFKFGDNTAPEADARSLRSFRATASVKLDGSASSDPDGDTLRYRWRFVSRPSGSALTNDDIQDSTSAQASFTADVEGVWQVQLTVRDHSLADTVVLPDLILRSLHDSDPWDDLSPAPGAGLSEVDDANGSN